MTQPDPGQQGVSVSASFSIVRDAAGRAYVRLNLQWGGAQFAMALPDDVDKFMNDLAAGGHMAARQARAANLGLEIIEGNGGGAAAAQAASTMDRLRGRDNPQA
jgi:hypothetical protein